ncbi:MAG: protein kinase domain-containing protein [Chthoniobacterales bacterium]
MDNRIFLKRYRLSLGRNGLPVELHRTPVGVTYRGHEIESGREVAMELIPAAGTDSSALEPLREEARAASQVRHLNIPSLQNFGVENDQLIYVTEYVDGPTAQAWVTARGPLPAGAVLRIAIQVVDALGAAGFHRLPHRALNPSNIIFLSNQAAGGDWPAIKLLHWMGPSSELARNGSAEQPLNESGRYASPEQLRGEPVDFPSSVYSLGCTMWFLLTGAAPPPASEIAWEKRSQLGGEKLRGLPKIVRHLLGRMLRQDPAERPQDPVALSAYLQTCLTRVERREKVGRRDVPPVAPVAAGAARTSSSFPLKALGYAALILVLAAGAAIALPRIWQARTNRNVAGDASLPVDVSFVTRPSYSKLSDYGASTTVAPSPSATAAARDESGASREVAQVTSASSVPTEAPAETVPPRAKPAEESESAPVVAETNEPPAAAVTSEPSAAMVAESAPPAQTEEKLTAAATPVPAPSAPAVEPLIEDSASQPEAAGSATPAPVIAQSNEVPSIAPEPTVAAVAETSAPAANEERTIAEATSSPEPSVALAKTPSPVTIEEQTIAQVTPAPSVAVSQDAVAALDSPPAEPEALPLLAGTNEAPAASLSPEPTAAAVAENSAPKQEEENLNAAPTPAPEPLAVASEVPATSQPPRAEPVEDASAAPVIAQVSETPAPEPTVATAVENTEPIQAEENPAATPAPQPSMADENTEGASSLADQPVEESTPAEAVAQKNETPKSEPESSEGAIVETIPAVDSGEKLVAALTPAPGPPSPAAGPGETNQAQDDQLESADESPAVAERNIPPPMEATPEPAASAPAVAETTPVEEKVTAEATPESEPEKPAPSHAKRRVAAKKASRVSKRSRTRVTHRRASSSTRKVSNSSAPAVKRAKPLPKLRVGSSPVELVGTTSDGKWILSTRDTGRKIIVPPPPGYGQ